MKGARGIRIAGVGNGNGPRRGLREDELCPENIYQIYHEAIKESSEEQSKKFKKRFKERFKERFDEGLNEITQDQFSEIFSDEKIDLLFDQLNSANLEEHLSMINQNKWQTYNSDDKIPENLQKNDREPPRESWGEETYKKLCFSCYLYRRKNLKDQPKNLTELLKKIDPYCDPDEEKIKKVLEEYNKYKELDGDEEKLQKEQSKIALKQAIKDALSIDKSKLPSINLEELKNTLIKKIDLALSLNSESKKGGDDISISRYIQCKQAFQDILFQKTQSTSSEEQDLTQPRKILKTSDEFKEFLTSNGGNNLSDTYVKAVFNEYKLYYNLASKLKNLQEIQSNGVSDDEFDKIEGFIDEMQKKELNASLVVNQPSMKTLASVESMDELDPQLQPIPAEDAKRDKVDEFEKFLNEIDLDFQITKDNYDEILSQYYEYKECEEKFMTRKSYNLNLDLISELTKSEKNLKNTISSCLQLSRKTKLPTIPYNEPTPYEINNKDFDKVLNYLKYEQIKNHDEQNPPPKNNYGPPKPNNILDDLVKSIGEIPSGIIRALDRFRTNSENGKGPPR